ncbi:MAG: prepilin-type N-terminal cleavage/methylation domain-containing protein [Erysipelotrichaceae bacterium]|nr:prepilin-type N-terminal cleavage/methylation domain-containing protein [Erysipelotrichaceae bacterium]
MRIRDRRKKGFTMAELLAVVAIIAILAGIGFIALSHYFRVLKQLEYDGIAKEIFISAQNHLSLADNESYLGTDNGDFGKNESGNIYYYVIGNDKSELNENSALALMLPFASIDETVRQGGSYVIRYDKSAARVLDVFYSAPKSMFGYAFADSDSADGDYSLLMSDVYYGNEQAAKVNRRKYRDNYVVGFYGSEEASDLDYTDKLVKPELVIDNSERLRIYVNNTQAIKTADENTKLRFIITGVTSKAECYIDIELKDIADKAEYILDSLTEADKHFHNLFCNDSPGAEDIQKTGNFIAGENIVVQAKVFRDDILSNVLFSDKKTTNSLFATDSTDSKALVSNIRHLENLSIEISNLNNTAKAKTAVAEQVRDLDWADFKTRIGDSFSGIYPIDSSKKTNNTYKPVNIDASNYLTYNGKNNKISNVVANESNAALFGSLKNSTIQNLILTDFNITGSSSAGALVAYADNVAVTNVAAYNSSSSSAKSIVGTQNAGGLIGYALNNSRISKSAAALCVSGNNAGGLIGYCDNSTVEGSYSGGHTTETQYDKENTNIFSASGNAGGLIGYSAGSVISSSYSTCSADGATAGGLIGDSNGNTVSNCYAVGYVKGDNDNKENKGLFIGKHTAGSLNGNSCLTVANVDLGPVGNLEKDNTNGVSLVDDNTYKYADFVKLSAQASTYDSQLGNLYNNTYLFRSIKDLDVSVDYTDINNDGIEDNTDGDGIYDLVAVHYGDWASYETFAVNIPQ